MRLNTSILLLIALFATGCAELPRQAGLVVSPPNSLETRRQEPGHNLLIGAELIAPDVLGIDVVVGSLPRPLPTRLLDDLVDANRPYSFWVPKIGYRGDDSLDCNDGEILDRDKQCREEKRVLQRETFRALLYRGEVAIGSVYWAIINRGATYTITLLPYGQGKVLGQGLNQLIISSDGQFGITTNGFTVDLSAVKDLRHLPEGFFERNPSLANIRSKDIESDEGYEFMGMLRKQFSDAYYLRSSPDQRYRGRPEAKVVWQTYTNFEHWPDRVMTCTSYRADPSLITAPLSPVKTVIAMGQAVNAAWIQEDCLKPYREREAPASRTDANRY